MSCGPPHKFVPLADDHYGVFIVQQPLMDQGIIIEASRSHSGTQLSVAFLWTSGQPARRVALQETVTHAAGGIRTGNPYE
jgi:hypothetical protein